MSYTGSPNSSRSSSRIQQLIPKKQQWALINQFKALEYEHMKQMEKVMDQEKKRRFKKELDNQLNNKHDRHEEEKQADRKYYEYITRKASQQKEREQQQKVNKIIKRKQVEQENQFYLDQMKNNRHMNTQPEYSLEIGVKSEMERKKIEEEHKKQMMDTLDKQLQMKAQERNQERNRSLEIDHANLKYQYERFDKKRQHNFGKKFGQNQNVYEFYQYLDQLKKQKQRELQHKIIDEAALKKMEEEDYKRYLKQMQRVNKINEMKYTLDQQIQSQHRKLQQTKRFNPEDNSYSVISGIFKEKTTPYNKQQYSQYLKKQAQQINLRRKKEQYMSDQEYKMNMNQLNRVVSGNYANQKYLDRSISAIGDGKINNTQINGKLYDEDADLIKMRLENIRARPQRSFSNNGSYLY